MRCLLPALVLLGEILTISMSHGAELKKPALTAGGRGSILVGRFELRTVEQENPAFSCHATSPSFNSALSFTKGGLSINSLKARPLGRSKQFTIRKRIDSQSHRFLIQVISSRSGTTARLQERVWSQNESACRFTYRGPFASL
jgi:hypothetical protein